MYVETNPGSFHIHRVHTRDMQRQMSRKTRIEPKYNRDQTASYARLGSLGIRLGYPAKSHLSSREFCCTQFFRTPVRLLRGTQTRFSRQFKQAEAKMQQLSLNKTLYHFSDSLTSSIINTWSK